MLQIYLYSVLVSLVFDFILNAQLLYVLDTLDYNKYLPSELRMTSITLKGAIKSSSKCFIPIFNLCIILMSTFSILILLSKKMRMEVIKEIGGIDFKIEGYEDYKNRR